MDIIKIETAEALQQAFDIRREVFVVEQQVPEPEEFDEYEDSSVHFLAIIDGMPVGTARWRETSSGLKLERFAVYQSSRGRGVGKALVKAVLEDIDALSARAEKRKYLHAQIDAMPLYAHFGFQPVGDVFDECNILHQTMEK